ncbi:MAG TPA: AMP-binding protein, partial [Acidimicrobiales bacterium]|nr:AMP-binding protein [Acidimicrobiales bacterium]
MVLVSFARRLSDLAAADPELPAVTCGGRTLSRGELERLGNRMARDLQARGVGVGDFVTVALPNSVDWFVAYLACWKTGAVPQPVSAK